MGEPFSRADLASLQGIMDAGNSQILEGIVEECAAVEQLQIELSMRPLALQKLQGALEHGISGCFGRQGHIQAAVP